MMKKSERIFREILYRVYEENELFLTQRMLVKRCQLSPGMVSTITTKLEQLGGIEKKPRGFTVIDAKRILMYWAYMRNLWKDVTYATCIPDSTSTIEAQLSADAIFTAHSGYTRKFGSTSDRYKTIFIYAEPGKIKRMFSTPPDMDTKRPNLFVLALDPHLSKLSKNRVAPIAQIYVDAYNLGTPGKPLIIELDEKLESTKIGAFKAVMREVREKF